MDPTPRVCCHGLIIVDVVQRTVHFLATFAERYGRAMVPPPLDW